MVALDYDPKTTTDRRSLRHELKALGITPLDDTHVNAYLAADKRQCRPTWTHHLLGIGFNALLWGALIPVLKPLLPRMEIMDRWKCAVGVAIILMIGGAVWGTIAPNPWTFLTLVPLGAWVTIVVLVIVWAQFWGGDEKMFDAVTYWTRHHPDSVWKDLPPDVQELTRYLRTELPGARLVIVARGDDPLLNVERNDEVCRVAAWDTPDDDLNFVPKMV